MSKKEKKQNSAAVESIAIIKPIVRDQKFKNVLEKIFEGDPEKLPVLKSIGYALVGAGNSWVSYVIKSRGKEILSIEVSEPNLRQIAEESAKTDFVTNFMDSGF